jgi:pyruvate dehydrogenase kinase 2/3/4
VPGPRGNDATSSPRGLARTRAFGAHNTSTSFLASKAMRLKLSGQLSREVSERRQVGDAEEMFADKGETPWWRNVGMDEGL